MYEFANVCVCVLVCLKYENLLFLNNSFECSTTVNFFSLFEILKIIFKKHFLLSVATLSKQKMNYIKIKLLPK